MDLSSPHDPRPSPAERPRRRHRLVGARRLDHRRGSVPRCRRLDRGRADRQRRGLRQRRAVRRHAGGRPAGRLAVRPLARRSRHDRRQVRERRAGAPAGRGLLRLGHFHPAAGDLGHGTRRHAHGLQSGAAVGRARAGEGPRGAAGDQRPVRRDLPAGPPDRPDAGRGAERAHARDPLPVGDGGGLRAVGPRRVGRARSRDRSREQAAAQPRRLARRLGRACSTARA